jgi:hypothetical protein
LGSRPGEDLHHLVEQCQSKEDRGNFPTSRINTTDNLAWIPKGVHELISSKYSTKDPLSGTTLRDALSREDWNYQHKRGTQEVNRAWQRYGQHDSSE